MTTRRQADQEQLELEAHAAEQLVLERSSFLDQVLHLVEERGYLVPGAVELADLRTRDALAAWVAAASRARSPAAPARVLELRAPPEPTPFKEFTKLVKGGSRRG